VNLKSLASDKQNFDCIACQKYFDLKKAIQTDKGLICEDHLATTDWKWIAAERGE
jgi:hypothetical protein